MRVTLTVNDGSGCMRGDLGRLLTLPLDSNLHLHYGDHDDSGAVHPSLSHCSLTIAYPLTVAQCLWTRSCPIYGWEIFLVH